MVPAKNFVGTLAANVNNERLTDAEFRQFVRNTISIVEGARVVDLDPPNVDPVAVPEAYPA